MKRFGSLLLSVLLIMVVSPGVQAIEDRQPLALRHSTTFIASSTSRVLIRFPKRIDILRDFNYSIEGHGRVEGFILRKSGRFEQEADRPLVLSINIGQCERRGCPGRESPPYLSTTNTGGKLSGVWDLYVIADGAPVSVSFVIDGLKGSRRVEVTDPVKAEVQTLAPTVHDTIAHSIFSAGDFTGLRTVDFGLVGLWFAGEPHGSSLFGDCLYFEEEDESSEEARFLPGCPTGQGQLRASTTPSADTWEVVFMSSGCCPIGLGGWYASASAVTRYGAVALWIDF